MIYLDGNEYEPYIGSEKLEKFTLGSTIIWEDEEIPPTPGEYTYLGSVFTNVISKPITKEMVDGLVKTPISVDKIDEMVIPCKRAKYSELYDNEDDYWDAMLDGPNPVYKSEEEFDEDNKLSILFACPSNTQYHLYDLFTEEDKLEGNFYGKTTLDGAEYNTYLIPSDVSADYRPRDLDTVKYKKA